MSKHSRQILQLGRQHALVQEIAEAVTMRNLGWVPTGVRPVVDRSIRETLLMPVVQEGDVQSTRGANALF